MNIRVIAITTKLADKVRTTLRSPGYGHPAHTELASGYGPCRHCLRFFAVGEEQRILFTCDAFHGTGALPLPGPVFIHAEACPRYDESAGFPAELLAHPLTLTAYGPDRALREEVQLTAGAPEELVGRLLARPDVDYLIVRDQTAGCYDFRIEANR
jgi:hypothetical protein